jgi:hypothetical protein
MEALGGLAVAERHIRALSTARADRGRSGDSPAARPRLTGRSSPFGQWRSYVAPRAPRPSSPPGREVCGGGYRPFNVETACAAFISWWTERARGAGGERSEQSRLSGPYSRECGAMLLFEREYPGQRPPARATEGSPLCERGATRPVSQRPEGFQLSAVSAVQSAVAVSFTSTQYETPDNHSLHFSRPSEQRGDVETRDAVSTRRTSPKHRSTSSTRPSGRDPNLFTVLARGLKRWQRPPAPWSPAD